MKRYGLISAVFLFAAAIPAVASLHGHGSAPPVAPVLSAALAQADGTDHALLAVTTDTGSGTLYYVVDTNCSTPTATQVRNGQNAAGSAAVIAANQAVSASGQQTANPAGTSAVATYCAFFTHVSGSASSVASVNSFKTPGTISWSNTFTAAWNALPQAAALTTVVQTVQQELTDCLTANLGNITVKPTYTAAAIGGGAVTSGQLAITVSYQTVLRPALLALPNLNKVQSTAYGNMPSTEPTGAGDNIDILCFQRAVIVDATTCNNQSVWFTTTIDSGNTYDTTADGTSNPSGGVSAWEFIMHESTEGLGRTWTKIDQAINTGLMDEFSYASSGVRSVSAATTHRFPSIDLGATNLISTNEYNQNTASGDAGDQTTGGSVVTAFTYTTGAGAIKGPLKAADIKLLSLVLGAGLSHSCRLTAGIGWP